MGAPKSEAARLPAPETRKTLFVISDLIGGPGNGLRVKILRGVKTIDVEIEGEGKHVYNGAGDGSPLVWAPEN
jgi:hypothetical protein